jgi:hypothetical protein
VAATLHDHLSATKAANAEAHTHLMELFSSMNSRFFTELKTVISKEAFARHQDQFDSLTGLAELRTLQAQSAENIGKLFDNQEQALYVNERNAAVQDQAMRNNEQLAKMDIPNNQPVDNCALHPERPDDLPVSRCIF